MIIVTGGAGFIGSAFIWKLNTEGVTDILVVDELESSQKWKNLNTLQFQDYIHKDNFLDMIVNDEFGDNIQAIIHMGACSSTTEANVDFLMENNTNYTKVLAEYCVEKNIYFQYASSAATYGNGEHGFDDNHDIVPKLVPINPYAFSKQQFDLWALKSGLMDHITGLKFFNVYGPNEYHKGSMKSLICKAYEQINETGTLNLFKSYKKEYEDGGQKRDFVYIKDCVDTMWWLLSNPDHAGLYNVGLGKAHSWNELAEAIFSAMNKSKNINYIDMPESIKNQYQYFTEAPTKKIESVGYNSQASSLNDSVSDYITNYLDKEFATLSWQH